MFKRILSILSVLIVLGVSSVSSVLAVSEINPPTFPSCTSPVGTLKVSYPSGLHGIVGQSGELTGSDSVYLLAESNLIQCFCAIDSNGIQTNWWKFGSLTVDQINSFKKLGWLYVPNGLSWGLDNASYMAINVNFACGSPSSGGGNGGTGGASSAPVCDSKQPAAPQLLSVFQSGTSATITWTKVELATHYTIHYGPDPKNYVYSVPNTGNVTSFTINSLDPRVTYSFAVVAVNNCMPGDLSGPAQVLGASTEVLGLAATGNMTKIVVFLVLSLISLLLSILSRKYGRAH